VLIWPVELSIVAAVFTRRRSHHYKRFHFYLDESKLEPSNDKKIRIKMVDLKFDKTYNDLAALLSDTMRLWILLEPSCLLASNEGFFLETSSDSPIGGGLGGSSSLCIR